MAIHETDHLGFEAPAPLEHPARASIPNGHPAGPALDEYLPDFTLPDHLGRPVTFHEHRQGRKVVLSFIRSVVW